MDILDELIAAGESIIENRKKSEDNVHSPPLKEKSYKESNSGFQKTSTLQNNKEVKLSYVPLDKHFAFLKKSPYLSERETDHKNKFSNMSPTGDNDSIFSCISKNICNSENETLSTASTHRSQVCSSESFSQLHIQKLKEECAVIFSLSHSMASSLFNANRLLNQMIKSESGGRSCVEESLLSEISSCDNSCKENEVELQESGSRIHYLLGQLSESYYRSKEQENTLTHIKDQAFALLDLTKGLLTINNLSHLVADIKDDRLSPVRLLEEVSLGLTLLSGELPSRFLQEQTMQLEDSRKYQQRLERK